MFRGTRCALLETFEPIRSIVHRSPTRGSVLSVEDLLFELRAQRDVLLRHFEAIDTKAGILLGFAAALATLAPGAGVVASAGRAAAIVSAIAALASFIPRRSPTIRSERLAELLVERAADERAS